MSLCTIGIIQLIFTDDFHFISFDFCADFTVEFDFRNNCNNNTPYRYKIQAKVFVVAISKLRQLETICAILSICWLLFCHCCFYFHFYFVNSVKQFELNFNKFKCIITDHKYFGLMSAIRCSWHQCLGFCICCRISSLVLIKISNA